MKIFLKNKLRLNSINRLIITFFWLMQILGRLPFRMYKKIKYKIVFSNKLRYIVYRMEIYEKYLNTLPLLHLSESAGLSLYVSLDYSPRKSIEKIIEESDMPIKIFIKNLLFFYNRDRATLDINENTQCASNKRRSLGDIYLIVKYYYPKVTLRYLLVTLIDLRKKNLMYEELRFSYCNTINKMVIHPEGADNIYGGMEYPGLESKKYKIKDLIAVYS